MTEMNHDLLDWVKSEGDNLGFNDISSVVKLREQASLRQYFRIFTDAGTTLVWLVIPIQLKINCSTLMQNI